MQRCSLFLLALIVGLGTNSLSFAQNTGGVFPPTVNEGHRSFQYRITVDPDNAAGETRVAQRLHYQQAINDDFMWRILGQGRRTANSDFDFDFLQAELFWQTAQRENYQGGVRFDARLSDAGRPGQLGFNWINQFKWNQSWNARFLTLLSAQVGSGAADGVVFQTRANIWKTTQVGNFGVELFNNYGNTQDSLSFDEQNHSVGPFYVRKFGKKSGWSVFAGTLFGISDAAADTELRFWVTKTFSGGIKK